MSLQTDEKGKLKLNWKMRQRLHLSWIHAEDCPERGNLVPRAERCGCGMPPVAALEIAREAALENLRWGLEDGQWTPPRAPGA